MPGGRSSAATGKPLIEWRPATIATAPPDELTDRACELAGIAPGDEVLEIGYGTGQLTRSLLARGLRVTTIEPGGRLTALARQNLTGNGDVRLLNASWRTHDSRASVSRLSSRRRRSTGSIPTSAGSELPTCSPLAVRSHSSSTSECTISTAAQDMKAGDKVFSAMDAGDAPGVRASVDMCEVKLELDA